MSMTLRERLLEEGYDNIALFDDMDSAFIGMGVRSDGMQVAVYSYEKTVECFMDQGMTYEDAVQWVSHNVTGAWIGPNTPIFTYELEENE